MLPFSIEQGTLDETSPVRLLAAAQLSQLTGTLAFQRDNVSKWLLLEKGAPVGARSSQLADSLGRLLVSWGWITQEAYVSSLERMDTGKEKHGQILASMGALDQNRIPEALRRQHLFRLADAVSWQAGSYQFSAGEISSRESFSLWKVFQEGLYRRHGKGGIERLAAERKRVPPRRVGGMLEPFLLAHPEALTIYDRVNGKRMVSELARAESNQTAFFTGLLVLEELGLVEFGSAIEEDPLEHAFKRARQLSPATLLRVAESATPEEVHQAVGRLLTRFPAEKFGESRFYTPLVSIIEEAGRKLAQTRRDAPLPVSDGVASPQAERAFQLAREYLAQRQPALAVQKFEEAIRQSPGNAEVQAYLSWARFMEAPAGEERRLRAEADIEEAAFANPEDADLQAYLGSLFKLSGRLVEAEAALQRALELNPEHGLAKRELESVKMRLGRNDDRNVINVAGIHSDAKIVLQRWIGGHAVIMNFNQDEVRIGTGAKDDMPLSEAVLPQVVPSHCSVINEHDTLYVRRNGSAGIVLLNRKPLEPRQKVHVTAEDRVTLGLPTEGQVLEFRVLDRGFIGKLRRDGGVVRNVNEDFWVG